MYRKFEGEADRSHHGPAPNRLYSTAHNMRTWISEGKARWDGKKAASFPVDPLAVSGCCMERHLFFFNHKAFFSIWILVPSVSTQPRSNMPPTCFQSSLLACAVWRSFQDAGKLRNLAEDVEMGLSTIGKVGLSNNK